MQETNNCYEFALSIYGKREMVVADDKKFILNASGCISLESEKTIVLSTYIK